jgi:hypothetical protein
VPQTQDPFPIMCFAAKNIFQVVEVNQSASEAHFTSPRCTLLHPRLELPSAAKPLVGPSPNFSTFSHLPTEDFERIHDH